MGENMRISDAEMEVLRALWAGDTWMSVGDVCARLEEKGWKYKTVGTFLLRLQEKGMLDAQKDGRVNLYRPRMSEAEYKRRETEEFLTQVHGGSMKSLLVALYGGTIDVSKADELSKWLKGR